MSRKILVIRFGSLGDIILSSALVTNLKVSFPDSTIVYLTRQKYRDTAAMIDSVDEIVTLSNKGSLWELFRLLIDLDNSDFSHIVDLHGNMRSWLARKFLTSGHSVVYPKRRLERLRMTKTMTKPKSLPQQFPHTIDLYNNTLDELGGIKPCARPLIRSDQLVPSTYQIPDNQIAVAIAPGASHINKQWPLERFQEVANQLQAENNVFIIWILTGQDAKLLEELPKVNNKHVTKLIDKPIPEIAHLISRCAVTIANDSGIAHLSSAVGTATLAIFGPTHPALGFSPRGLFDELVEVDEYCRPCSRHGHKLCYREEQYCFTKIDAARVVTHAIKLINKKNELRPALFIDRDGTLIVNKHYLADPDQVEMEAGGLEALRIAKEKGYRIVIVSNQSGVARGILSTDDVEKVNARLLEILDDENLSPDGIYYCPHHPSADLRNEYSRVCNCRKPYPGMVEDAANELSLDIRKSYVIGDSIDDYNLAVSCGAKPLVVRSGHGRSTESKLRQAGVTGNSLYFQNILAAVESLPRVLN